MKRTENTIKNISTGIVGHILVLISQFACRTVFIHILGTEYLGLNGLFSNILQILMLSEMGFGTAMLYSLYKPIASNDTYTINAILVVYKKVYRVISAIVLILGLSITPFLNYLIKDTPDIPHLRLIYIMYVINTVLSYIYIYKRSVIEADQKSYVINKYQKGISIAQNLLQIVFLLITRNYIVYMALLLLATISTNIFISKRANKDYPYILDKGNFVLEIKQVDNIKKNTYALFLHRIGGVVVNSTDNLIMSAFIGLIDVGLYSNYLLITTNLNTFIAIVFNSATASVGNLGVSATKEHLKDVFNKLFFLAFFIYGFCAIALFCLFNPFITVWLGEEYCFDILTVGLIVINFYLNGTRILMRIFRDAFGLFWYFRYKSVFEALVNLVASIIMVRVWGINGVLFGTTLSTLFVAFWIEPYVLYKYVFDDGPGEYFVTYIKYVLYIAIVGGICYCLVRSMPHTIQGFVLSCLLLSIVSIVGLLLLNLKNEYLSYYFDIIMKKVIKR